MICAFVVSGGWPVPFRYFVVSSFCLALWRGKKTKKRHAKKTPRENLKKRHMKRRTNEIRHVKRRQTQTRAKKRKNVMRNYTI